MSLLAGFAVVVTEAVIGFYKKIHAINFGIYGATMVGKTTLHHQLRTREKCQQYRKELLVVIEPLENQLN